MDFKSAIERNRAPLLVEVLKLFAMIGLAEGITIERLSRPLHREVLRILRTVESAVRRLIVAAARDIVVEYKPRPPAARKKPGSPGGDKSRAADGEARPKRKRGFLFKLFDPVKRIRRRIRKMRRAEPRIHVLGGPDPRIPEFLRPQAPAPAPPPAIEKRVDDGTVNAVPLVRRLVAVLGAVQDIPRHAMRLARWHARPKEERRPERWSPLRAGRPPGFRRRNIYEVDAILKECDWLARLGNPSLDTS
ncbi:MAG: hypothetical protein JNM20_10885 [Rhizobiales bacterium]|nr:hypothetical protein [Hyphomicrobiales bacterium]